MPNASQEKYLSYFPDDKVVEIKPYDSRVRLVAEGIIETLKNALPEVHVHFGGGAALGIAGQNDIDIEMLSHPDKFAELTPIITGLYGEPARKGSSVKWEFNKSGFDVELALVDEHSPYVAERIRIFEILSQDEKLRREYEQMKLPYGTVNFKEYMRKKYDFFNRLLENDPISSRG